MTASKKLIVYNKKIIKIIIIFKNSKQQTPQQTTKSSKKPINNHHSKINQNQIQTANIQNPSTHFEINQITPRDQPKTNQKSSKITKSHRQSLHQAPPRDPHCQLHYETHIVNSSLARSTPRRSSSTARFLQPIWEKESRGRVALGFLKWEEYQMEERVK